MELVDSRSKFYRLLTILRSFFALYRLTPKQVDSFIKSYEVYDCDWVDGKAIRGSQIVDYADVKKNIITWYEVLNHLCAIGNVEKMYIPPSMDLNKNVFENQKLYEKQFAEWLGMKKGDQVFELGCGRGRVASHLASITGAHITGINIDQTQLDSGNAYIKKNGLTNQCTFLKADFNDLPFPFPDNHFDCIYEVQVLSLSRDLDKLFRELHRILKPGGRISLCEWVRLPGYDPNNPHHAELLRLIKPLVGAIGTPSVERYEKALRNAGFKVTMSKNPSINDLQVPLINKTTGYFDKVWATIKFLTKIKILPKHFVTLFERLGRHSDALCEADRLGLICMVYHFIAEK